MSDKPDNYNNTAGDFIDLLERSGYSWPKAIAGLTPIDKASLTQGTTVLAFHFKGGAIVAGDRRATAGNSIMYARCDKVIAIDDYSLMAIAGVPATAFEMARILSHNFEYYRRSQLQPLSTEGKIRALSKLLKDNMGLAMQGVGAVSRGIKDFHFDALIGFCQLKVSVADDTIILGHRLRMREAPAIKIAEQHRVHALQFDQRN